MQVDFRKRGIGVAIAVTLVIPLALGLMFYPPAHMELKNMPFGVLSLDEGVGEAALGNQLVSKIENGDFAALAQGSEEDGEEATETKTTMTDILKFEVFESQEALDAAFDANELYGAFVVQPNFTEVQMKAMAAKAAAAQGAADPMAATQALAAQGAADPAAAAQAMAAAQAAAASSDEEGNDDAEPVVKVVLDYAKSPLVASQLEANVSSALSSLGVDVAVEVIDQGPAADAENASMLSGMLSQMMVLMPLLICSMLAGAFAVLGLGIRGATSTAKRVKRVGLAWVVDAVAALAVALMSFWLLTCVAGLPVDFGPYFGFAWLASFLLMVFFSGCACIHGRVAIAMGVIIILLGMTSGYLPYEGLPMFWQDWVCPWAPQFYLGNGLREVIFAGEGIWNQGTIVAGIYALVGILLACLGLMISARMAKREPSGEATE